MCPVHGGVQICTCSISLYILVTVTSFSSCASPQVNLRPLYCWRIQKERTCSLMRDQRWKLVTIVTYMKTMCIAHQPNRNFKKEQKETHLIFLSQGAFSMQMMKPSSVRPLISSLLTLQLCVLLKLFVRRSFYIYPVVAKGGQPTQLNAASDMLALAGQTLVLSEKVCGHANWGELGTQGSWKIVPTQYILS